MGDYGPRACSAGLTEGEGLVGGDESHELRHLDDLDVADAINIEVVPGLQEVGVKVGLESGAGKALVGSEDLGGSSAGTSLVHPELAGGLAVDLLAIGILVAGALLDGVVRNHRSHEDVIGVSGEVGGDGSLVANAVDVLVLVEGGVPLVGLHEFLIGRVRVRLGGGLLNKGGVIGVTGVSLLNGVGAVGLLDLRVGLVLVDGSESPHGLSSIGKTKEDGDSELHLYF